MTDYSPESGRRADAQTIIDEIERTLARQGTNAENAADPRSLKWDDPQHRRMVREKFREFDEPLLPGFGELGQGRNAHDDCGNPHPFVCDSCGQSVDFGRTCGQSVCARCGVAWIRDTGVNKSAKVRRVRKEKHQHTPDSEHQKLHHQIISPPLGWYFDLAAAGLSLEEAQDVTKDVVKSILDELRAQGVVVRHSFRGANDDGTLKEESDDRGLWKERLNSGREWFGDVREELAWKPHFHCVVVSDWIKASGDGDGGNNRDAAGLTERVENATGWVLHRITGDDGTSLPTDGAMARALTYTLSHADIDVDLEGHNRSAVWECGSFEGDPIRSTGRFSARPSDLDWADSVIRRIAGEILGLSSGSTDCGADLPGVDDPDELARRIIEELYPQHDRPAHRDVDADTVLYHVSEGNLSVDVETTAGGGGDVTVFDAFGDRVGPDGWGSDLPDAPGSATFDGADEPPTTLLDHDQADDVDDCGCGDDHVDGQPGDDDLECDGQLIPLEEARQRELLDDSDWCADAPHVDQAREADQEWPEDLDPWKTDPPGKAIGAS